MCNILNTWLANFRVKVEQIYSLIQAQVLFF